MKIRQRGDSSYILIIVIVLLLIIGGAMYYFYSRSSNLDQPNLQPSPSMSPISSPSEVPLAQEPTIFPSPVDNTGSFPEGQSCGRNAGAAGDAKCAAGLICKYSTEQDEANGIGVCTKP